MSNRFTKICLVSAAFAAGCGDGVTRYPVSGRILIDGEPLAYGYIKVFPQGARPASSLIDQDGRFSLMTSGVGEGVPVGNHPIEVSGRESLDAYTIKWHAPVKYSKRGQSGLTINVVGATSDEVVELSWDGKEPFVKNYN